MNSHLIGLTDLRLVADAACELDAYKFHLSGPERDRIVRMVDQLHSLAMRVAGDQVELIYGPDEQPEPILQVCEVAA